MAEDNTGNTTPTVTSRHEDGNAFLKRELSGATFLSLEHFGHMLLVVVVAALIAVGAISALNMWTGGATSSPLAMGGASLPATGYLEAMGAIGIVSALLVLVPLMVVLGRRTRAEWQKRPGYAGRVAYKLPLYGALAVVITIKISTVITMVSVIIGSLAVLGMEGQDIGAMYLSQFVPALIVFLTLLGTGWYLFKLAKGADHGRLYSMILAAKSAALVLALLITAIVVLHQKPVTTEGDFSDYLDNLRGNSDSRSLDDLFSE